MTTSVKNLDSKRLGTVGFIGRFKPLHNGAVLALDMLCEQASKVKIGIGSSNKYNLRNPFTAEETEAMVRAYLKPKFNNFEIIPVPDFAHDTRYADGQKWKQYVVDNFGPLNYFVSGNSFVKSLLDSSYQVIHPAYCIPRERWLILRATEVRVEMAKGGDNWKNLVPRPVVDYILNNNLLVRFQSEFGAETLQEANSENYKRTETREEETNHAREK
ncbi:MAG TPA: hypothetical protein VJC39_02405 [Candidatus Nanoarchaeia archaeon]|nr:hypothetical protein [Candidatus Nanoarchaeia archaeon]